MSTGKLENDQCIQKLKINIINSNHDQKQSRKKRVKLAS